MTANLGIADRMIRLIVGVVLIVAPLLNIPAIWSSGLLAYASMAIGATLAATAMFRTCPLYRILGISSCRD